MAGFAPKARALAKARAAGYRVAYTPASTIYHYGQRTPGRTESRFQHFDDKTGSAKRFEIKGLSVAPCAVPWRRDKTLQRRGVHMLAGVEYVAIDDAGLHIRVDGTPRLLDVDTVIICAGQEPARQLYDALLATGQSAHLIGGAFEASELDAKRAIKQATELAVVV